MKHNIAVDCRDYPRRKNVPVIPLWTKEKERVFRAAMRVYTRRDMINCRVRKWEWREFDDACYTLAKRGARGRK